MKCELCHQAAAERAVRKKVDGVEQELYVSKACAEEAARPRPAPALRRAPRTGALRSCR